MTRAKQKRYRFPLPKRPPGGKGKFVKFVHDEFWNTDKRRAWRLVIDGLMQKHGIDFCYDQGDRLFVEKGVSPGCAVVLCNGEGTGELFSWDWKKREWKEDNPNYSITLVEAKSRFEKALAAIIKPKLENRGLAKGVLRLSFDVEYSILTCRLWHPALDDYAGMKSEKTGEALLEVGVTGELLRENSDWAAEEVTKRLLDDVDFILKKEKKKKSSRREKLEEGRLRVFEQHFLEVVHTRLEMSGVELTKDSKVGIERVEHNGLLIGTVRLACISGEQEEFSRHQTMGVVKATKAPDFLAATLATELVEDVASWYHQLPPGLDKGPSTIALYGDKPAQEHTWRFLDYELKDIRSWRELEENGQPVSMLSPAEPAYTSPQMKTRQCPRCGLEACMHSRGE
jgi:hypothetical protein